MDTGLWRKSWIGNSDAVVADGKIREAETAFAVGDEGVVDLRGEVDDFDGCVWNQAAGWIGDAAAERGIVDGLLCGERAENGQDEYKERKTISGVLHEIPQSIGRMWGADGR
jgi:hypothetical protein